MSYLFLEQIRKSWVTHPDKPEETPESTLRALYFAAIGEPVSVQKAKTLPLPDLNQEALKRLATLVEQRCSRIPLAYLTGRQSFMGIEMLAGPQALIPRSETQLLGYETLSIVRLLSSARKPVTLIDVCTGSGNIVLGVLAHEARCRAFGSDLSQTAISLACDNAEYIGVNNRVEFKTGDLFEPFDSDNFSEKADIISCNPPYISSLKVPTLYPEISRYEPRIAFDGGSFGLDILKRVINEAPKYMKPQSYLCLEVGIGQGNFVTRMLKNSNLYRKIRPVVDDTSNVRVIVACT
jgi:release factor glutamine methyltransferase